MTHLGPRQKKVMEILSGSRGGLTMRHIDSRIEPGIGFAKVAEVMSSLRIRGLVCRSSDGFYRLTISGKAYMQELSNVES